MEAARWERMQALFHEAVERHADARLPFLREACGGDAALLAEVSAMLDEDSRSASLLDRDVAGLAERMLEERDAPPDGRTLGPYRLRRTLGEGGMGVVYLAEREDLASVVAIKVLRDAWMSPARRERFAVEQRTLASLNHPAIARLYDADTSQDGTPWFAMEYVEGVPITEACARRNRPLHERLRLFRAVCEAVQFAHRHAVIHRDLKPSNILVTGDGAEARVKLLDFGIAKRLDELDGEALATRTGLRLLTPAYASPEQIRGERVGVQTDVYSLGVLLHELLTGQRPFEGGTVTPAEVEARILRDDPERPSAAARRAGTDSGAVTAGKRDWADLDVLCATAMQKEPERRYGSVEALQRDVDHFLSGEPLEARPERLAYRAGKFVARHRTGVATAAAVAAAVLVLVVFFTVRLARARDAAVAEAARTARIQRFTLSLFDGGDKEAGPAADLRVLTLLDRGVAQASNLNAEPAVQAELYDTLGGIYQKLGRFDRADELLSLALARRKALLGKDHDATGKGVLALGLLRMDQAKLPEAERLVREGLALAERRRPPDPVEVAGAKVALGQVLQARGSFDQAIAVLDEAVRLQSAPGPESAELASTLYELANAHFYAGHLDLAEDLNERLLLVHRRLYGDRHPAVADDLINLGAIEFERGHYAPAEGFYRRALEITRAYYGADHFKTASNLTMLGRSLVFLDRYDEAVGTLEEALAIQERVNGPVHPRVASVLNELGNVAIQRNRLDEAETRFQRLAEMYRSIHGDAHPHVALALANLASAYMKKGDNARAEPIFREVIERFTRALSPDHLNTGIARIKLGRVLLRQKKYTEAAASSLAGFQVVSRQASPSVSFLKAAREDLIAAYEALGQKEKAAEFRAP